MNANELAIELERHCTGKVGCEYLDQAATMLRQQQAEIEALKKDNKELHAIAQRMAMAESDARKSLQNFKDYATTSTSEESVITWKLEAKFKELTDGEILEVWASEEYYTLDKQGYADEFKFNEFAKAILRKAQEK